MKPTKQPEQMEQPQEYGIYQPHLGRLVLQGGPGTHWVCCEANTVLKGFVLPYRGEAIEASDIPPLIAAGWLPLEFQLPITAYCPVCRRTVDTKVQNSGRVCMKCGSYTFPLMPNLPPPNET